MALDPTYNDKSFRYRTIGIFLITLAYVGVDFYLVLSNATHRGQVFGRDFIQYWSASILFQDGLYDVLYSSREFNAFLADIFTSDLATHGFHYPPHGLFVIQPLGFLPYHLSYVLWSAVTLVLFLLAIGLPDWSRFKIYLALLAPTTLLVINFGQNGLLSGALFVGGMRLLDRRPILAGIPLGLLSFKPHLGLLIPLALLAARLWWPIVAASLTVAAMAGWSLAMGGLDLWAAYLQQDAMSAALAILKHGSGALMSMMITPFMATRILGFEAGTGYAVQILFAAIAVPSVVWSFWHGNDRCLQIAILATATFLVSPYLFNYDMAMLLGALIFVFDKSTRARFQPYEQFILLSAWALPVLGMFLNHWRLPLGPAFLLALLVMLMLRQHRIKNGSVPAM